MFGIATAISSLFAVIGNIIAGIIIKRPTLYDWRKLFIVFFVVYLFGGIIYVLLGSAEPEPWATFKAQEQNRVRAEEDEETVPMREQSSNEKTGRVDA